MHQRQNGRYLQTVAHHLPEREGAAAQMAQWVSIKVFANNILSVVVFLKTVEKRYAAIIKRREQLHPLNKSVLAGIKPESLSEPFDYNRALQTGIHRKETLTVRAPPQAVRDSVM